MQFEGNDVVDWDAWGTLGADPEEEPDEVPTKGRVPRLIRGLLIPSRAITRRPDEDIVNSRIVYDS